MNERKGFLILITGIFLFVTFFFVKPFINSILFSLILTFITKPLYKKMVPRTGSNISSAITVLITVIVLVVPLVITSAVVIRDARQVISQIDEQQTINLEEIEIRIKQITGQDVDLEARLMNVISSFINLIFGNFALAIDRLVKVIIGFTLMLFLQYYLLKDGGLFTNWVIDAIPLPDHVKSGLYKDTEKITRAVVRGHVLIAIIQGLVAGLGIFIAGIPNLFFWAFVMVLFSLIPFVGSIGIWGPASLYLILSNQIFQGIFLLVYGVLVVGLTDNFLRPLLVDRSSELHPAVIILGVLGGVFVLGVPGIFFGPITLGILKSLMRIFGYHYDDLK